MGKRRRKPKIFVLNLVWRCTPVISAFGRLREGDPKFKASLGFISKLCLKRK
jgi:hypothetical protein